MKKRFLFFLCAVEILCACSIKKHTVTNTEQNTSDFRLQTSLQTKVLLDSVLQSVDFKADSVTILVTPSLPVSNVEAGSYYPSELVREDRGRTAAALKSQSEFPCSEQVLTRAAPVLSGSPSIRITAHNPQVKAEKQKRNLVVTQQVEQDSAANSVQANSHADVSKDSIGVASPMNGTIVTVIVLLAVLIIAAIVLLLFLRKYKII